MKTALALAGLACLVAISGCGDSGSRYRQRPTQNQPAPKPKRPPTPEEILGIKKPGKLAASVEAWADTNELGEYFRLSRDRLAKLHAQLIEDYNVRIESELAPTDFTRETLRKYQEALDADTALRRFMVECYSRKEPRPLPQSIADKFLTRSGMREWARQVVNETPAIIDQLNKELAALKDEMASAGTFTWMQEEDLSVWRDIQTRVRDIFARASKANANAVVLAANMAKAASSIENNESIDKLNGQAGQLKGDFLSFVVSSARQLEIVNGQMIIAEFARNCKGMSDGIIAVPAALAKKKARLGEIKELASRITSSRMRGYSDLGELAQQVEAIKARSRSEGETEVELGKRVRKLAGDYESVFGPSAINKLKRALPAPPAQARVESVLQSFKREINLPQGSDPAGMFAGIESKAYQLADRMEEDAMLKRLDDTLRTVQRIAAKQKR